MGQSTVYKWRAKYGGMDALLITRMKALEAENHGLKKVRKRAFKSWNYTRSHGKKVVVASERK